MKLVRTARGYVVEVPADVVAALGLREGDEVTVARSHVVGQPASQDDRDRAIARMRELARPLPPDYKFDREEANAR